MKNVSLQIVCMALIVCFAGCSKKKDIESTIAGIWELRQTSAAMNPNATEYAPGNGNLLTFDNGNYEKFINGVFDRRGQFTISKDPNVQENVCLVLPAGQFTNRVIFDGGSTNILSLTDGKVFLQISGDQLTFIWGCYAYDAGQKFVYQRIKIDGVQLP